MRGRLPLPREVLLAFIVCAAALWGAIAWLLYDAHRDAIDAANAANSNLARSIAEYEESSVRAVDLSLRLLRDEWARGRAAFDATVARHEDYLRKEKVIQVAVVDPAGDVLYSRMPLAGSPNFADRDYFRLQKAARSDELFVSPPVLGRITGQWAIQFSRPILDEQGRFAGLIVMAVPPPALEGVYNDIRLGSQGVISLALADGAILARTGELAQAVRVSLARAAGLAPEDPPSGDYRARGLVDGVDRFYSYRKLQSYPLIVFVGQSAGTVLGPFYEEAAMLAGSGVLATALLVALAALAAARTRERRRFVEERERLMGDLHDSCIQSIYAIGLGLENCRRVMARDPAQAADLLAGAGASLSLVIQDLRSFIAGEPQPARSEEEFVAELRRAVPDLGEGGPAFSFDIDRAAVRALTPEQALQVRRIAQEAVSNVLRHAKAKRARLSLALRGRELELDVEDDGTGFGAPPAQHLGLGLHHIQVRARKLGGRASVGPAPRGGTRLLVQFPQRP